MDVPDIHRRRLERCRSLLLSLELHSPGESSHGERVASYAVATGEKLGLSDDDLRDLRLASAFHDIGKIRVEKSLLELHRALDGAEVIRIRAHAAIGHEMLSKEPLLWHLADSVGSHHERWDGQGYPLGLQQLQIPLSARIIAVAEAFDSMTTDSRWRIPLTDMEAFAEIQRGSGTQFDPECVVCFMDVQPIIQPIIGLTRLKS